MDKLIVFQEIQFFKKKFQKILILKIVVFILVNMIFVVELVQKENELVKGEAVIDRKSVV